MVFTKPMLYSSETKAAGKNNGRVESYSGDEYQGFAEINMSFPSPEESNERKVPQKGVLP